MRKSPGASSRCSQQVSKDPQTPGQWPPVFLPADTLSGVTFRHLATVPDAVATGEGGRPASAAGRTAWAACPDGDGVEIGLAWRWVLISGHGVLVIDDPLAIDTNVVLLCSSGGRLPSMEALRHLNEVVRRLPWQEEAFLAISGAMN